MNDVNTSNYATNKIDTGSKGGRHSQKVIVPSHNLLIASLPQIEATKLVAASKGVFLKSRDVIYEGGDEIQYLYFPIDAVISSLAILEDGSTVEIAMTGREGLVGIAALMGGGRALHWTSVTVPGTALKISTAALSYLFFREEHLHAGVLRSYRAQFTQICQRSVCNVRHGLLQRLCVWLLMMHDRVGRAELPLTQEEIAGRLSVRRAGVSVACSMLQSMHGITSRRGRIAIVDRDTIEHAACECYEVLRREFDADPPGGGGPLVRREGLAWGPGVINQARPPQVSIHSI